LSVITLKLFQLYDATTTSCVRDTTGGFLLNHFTEQVKMSR